MEFLELLFGGLFFLVFPEFVAIPLFVLLIPFMLIAAYVIAVIVILVHYKSIGKL